MVSKTTYLTSYSNLGSFGPGLDSLLHGTCSLPLIFVLDSAQDLFGPFCAVPGATVDTADFARS